MSKHTPGPWTFFTPYGGKIGPSVRQVRVAAYHTEYGPEIALCDCDPTEGVLATKFPPITREQRVANAYLIAAAPDLLAALEDVELSTTQAQMASTIGRQSGQKQADFLRRQLEQIGLEARAAINKAKGTTL